MSKSNEQLIVAIRDLVPNPDPNNYSNEANPARRSHLSVQARLKRRFRSLKCEIPLQATLEIDNEEIVVNGRLDGFRRTRCGIVIYEIKPVQGSAKTWIGDIRLQGARRQLMLYMDLAAHTNSPLWKRSSVIEGELILAGTDGSIAYEKLDLPLSFNALKRRLKALLKSKIRQRQLFSIEHLERFAADDKTSDRAAQETAFRRITSTESPRILLVMPPGSGKTRIAFRFAIQQAAKTGCPLNWITVKSRGRDAVVEEANRYRRAAVDLRLLWKTAADRLCECDTPVAVCPIRFQTEDRLFWDGYPAKMLSTGWSIEDINDAASENGLCPHELSCVAEPLADIVIADVNYLISPSSLRHHNAVVVFDEAQNLTRRIREYYQQAISSEDFMQMLHHARFSEREELNKLLSNRSIDLVTEIETDRWLHIFTLLQSHDSLNDKGNAFLRVLQLWERFPQAVHFAWYYGNGSPMLLGAPIRINEIFDSAISSFSNVIALSGSLPADESICQMVFPGKDFERIEITYSERSPVFICPILEFSHPISFKDHEKAAQCLKKIVGKCGGTVLVFGQNRASNELLAARLSVRGFVVLLDDDMREDWSVLQAVKPDFLFVALGSLLSESVNPPHDIFSCAVVLSAGFIAPDPFTHFRRLHSKKEAYELPDSYTALPDEAVAEATARVIQAVGRVQRDPESTKPAFLLARRLAEPDFMRAWPKHWIGGSHSDLLTVNLEDAFQRAANRY